MKVNHRDIGGDKPFVLSGIIYAGLFVLLGMSSSSYAVLTARTANTIQGVAPSFKSTVDENANKLGFAVNGTFYSEHSENIASGTAKTFSGYLSLSDFAVKSLAATDFTVADDYLDGDNDGANSTVPFSVGTTSYSWQDASGAEIPQTNYDDVIGCGSDYSMPLILTIQTPDVQVHSEYGDPRSSAATILTKSYLINIDSYSGICFVKPRSLKSVPKSLNGGGYTTDFDPVNGFKASPTVSSANFPTTGFSGAEFQLVMSGAQTDYSYTVPTNPGSGVEVNENGFVTLNSKPTGAVTVRATLKTDTLVFYDYTFNPTTVWAVPQTGKDYWVTSLAKCGEATNVLTRAELTNSPMNVAPPSWVYVDNFYTRAIKGGVFGEWGNTGSNIYSGSNWPDTGSNPFYWTPEKHDGKDGIEFWFVVRPYDGLVSYSSSSCFIACRG